MWGKEGPGHVLKHVTETRAGKASQCSPQQLGKSSLGHSPAPWLTLHPRATAASPTTRQLLQPCPNPVLFSPC